MTVKSFFGAMLMAIGGLIAVLAGICSMVATIAGGTKFLKGIVGGHWTGNMFAWLPIVLFIGGIPFVVGYGMYRLGKSLRKPEEEADDQGDEQ